MQFLYNPHNQALATQVFPSKIGEGFKTVEVALPLTLNATVANSSMSYNQIQTLFTETELSDEFISNTIASLNDNNSINFNLDLQLLGVYFNIKNRDKTGNIASFSFTVTERAIAGLHFPKNLFQTIYEGNSQFAGELVSFTPARLDVLAYHDFAVGVAIPLEVGPPLARMKLTPGARLRYLVGLASVNSQRTQVSMFTEANGQYIDFNYDYEINTAFPTADQLLSGTGSGFALDLGTSLQINDMFSADVSDQ